MNVCNHLVGPDVREDDGLLSTFSFSTTQSKPLSQLLADAHSLTQQAEQAPDRETQKRLQECALSTLNNAIARVETSAIFSLNEELEDVPTADLRYLLLPAMRGDLLHGLVTSMAVDAVGVMSQKNVLFSVHSLPV